MKKTPFETIPLETGPEAYSENSIKSKVEMLRYAEQIGYKSVESIDGLELTEEEIKRIGHANFQEIKKLNDSQRGIYLLGTHDSGVQVKILAESLRTAEQGGKFYVHSFSPVYFEGHGSSNDFYASEMRSNLNFSLHGKKYDLDTKRE